MKPAARKILLVEDNDDDIFFMRRSVKTANLAWEMEVVTDGQAAIDYLTGAADGEGEGNEIPKMILLDLKLPRRSGLEVLEWIKTHPKLKSCVVIMLTTSAEANDVYKAYELGANSYLVKPASVKLLPMLTALENYWFECNRFP